MMVRPTLEEIFQPSFGKLLAMAHLAAFLPLLLSILLGATTTGGAKRRTDQMSASGQKPT
jgi:hypothetical protein